LLKAATLWQLRRCFRMASYQVHTIKQRGVTTALHTNDSGLFAALCASNNEHLITDSES